MQKLVKATKTPEKGDWVFYTTTGSTSSNPDAYYAHVGMVVNVSGNNITTVEGNLSDTITSPALTTMPRQLTSVIIISPFWDLPPPTGTNPSCKKPLL